MTTAAETPMTEGQLMILAGRGNQVAKDALAKIREERRAEYVQWRAENQGKSTAAAFS